MKLLRLWALIVSLQLLTYKASALSSGMFPNDTDFQACERHVSDVYENLLVPVNWKISIVIWYSAYFDRTFVTYYYALGLYTEYNNSITQGTFNTCAALLQPTAPVFNPIINTVDRGNLDVPKQCGSIINPSKQAVTENIPVDGTAFTLSYSSEFNSKRRVNFSLYEEFSLSTTMTASQRIRISDISGNTLTTIPFFPSTGTIINWPWDEVLNSVSTHPAMNKGTFGYTLERGIAGFNNPSFYSGGTSGNIASMYYTIYDYNQTVLHKYPMFGTGLATSSWAEELTKYKTIAVYHPEAWGLGGFTLTPHHFLDRDSKTLFNGSGQKIVYKTVVTKNIPPYGIVDMVSRYDDNEVYLFDQTGQHLETRSKILGKSIYRFSYDGSHKLIAITDKFNRQTNLIYNSDGSIAKIIAPYGQETSFTSFAGMATKVQDSRGHAYTLEYNANRFLTRFEKPNGEVTTFAYNADGDFLSESKNTGLLQRFQLNFSDLVKNFTAQTNFGVKSIISVSESENGIATDTKNGNGVLQTSTLIREGLYKIVNFSPTSLGHLQFNYISDTAWGASFNEAAPEQYYTESNQNISYRPVNKTTYTYSSSTDPTTLTTVRTDVATASSLYPTYSILNVADRKIQIKNDAYGGRTSTIYLNDDETVSRVEPGTEYPTDFTYDSAGRLTKSQKGPAVENYSYDQFGFLSQITNSLGQATQFIRNSQGQVLTKVLPNADQIKFEYTNGGGLKKITTPSNQIHYFQKDVGDYLSNYVNPESQSTSYIYDADKRLSQVSMPSGRSLDYSYEAGTGNLSAVQTNHGAYSFTAYDTQGRLHNTSSPDAVSLQLDWIGPKIASQTWKDQNGTTIATLQFGYQPIYFSLESVKINNAQAYTISASPQSDDVAIINAIYYTYNFPTDANGVKSQKIATDGVTTITYETIDANNGTSPTKSVKFTAKSVTGPLTTITLERKFNSFGRATESSTTVIEQSTNELIYASRLSTTYNENNQLVGLKKSHPAFASGTLFDVTDYENNYGFAEGSNGNLQTYAQIISRTGIKSVDIGKKNVYTYGADDRLLSVQGTLNRTYTYNSDGQPDTMIDGAGTTSYNYDVVGNLKSALLPNGKLIEYKYDGLDRRVKKIVNGAVEEYYLWYDRTRLAAVLDATKTVKLSYGYGPDSDAPSLMVKDGIQYRLVQDPALGSIRYVLHPNSALIMQELDYDEYGNIVKNTDPTFQNLGFAGGLMDTDTKLVHFGARDYDPTIGRWTSKDPSLFDGGTTNLYEYAFSDPMSYIDRDGRHPALIAFGIGFGIGFGSGWAIQKQIKPTSTRSELISAGLEGGFITGTTAVFGAFEAIGVGTAALLEASGLSFAFLSGPNNTGINSQDLNGGIKYIQGINRPTTQPQNACPGN